MNKQVKTRGLSIVEMVVWIAVVALLVSAMTVAILRIYSDSDYLFNRALGIISGRKGMEELMDTIRGATYSESGAYPIISFAPNELEFYADVDKDDVVEKVRLFIESGQLKEGVVEPVGTPAQYNGQEDIKTIVYNVRNEALSKDLFTYYDESGNTIINFIDVLAPKYISILLITNTGKNPQVIDYEIIGSVFLRNINN